MHTCSVVCGIQVGVRYANMECGVRYIGGRAVRQHGVWCAVYRRARVIATWIVLCGIPVDVRYPNMTRHVRDRGGRSSWHLRL